MSVLFFFIKTSFELFVTLTDLLFFPGGWWRLWCVLYHCGGKPYHIPHLQQILLSQHCKKDQRPPRKTPPKKDISTIWICPLLCALSPSVCLSVCDVQDSRRFGQHISKAMLDIRALFETEHHHKVENEKPPQMENGKKHMWQSHQCCSWLRKTEHLWRQVALSRFRRWPFHCQTKREVFIYLYLYVIWCTQIVR